MSLDERQKTFIGYLLNLAKEGKEDRGALADLRSGLGKEPGEMARVHKHVAPRLPEKNYNDRWYYLTAAQPGRVPAASSPAFAGTSRTGGLFVGVGPKGGRRPTTPVTISTLG